MSRHSLTSISISLGTDVYSMKTMLGHKSVRQTESYINTINDVETSTKNVNKINKNVNNINKHVNTINKNVNNINKKCQ